MGGSYRAALQYGGMTEWETKLRQAVALINEVRSAVLDTIGDDGQYDNAADDGGLREKLGIAVRFIEEELPTVPRA